LVSCSGEEWKGSRRSSWANRGRAVGGRVSQSWLGGVGWSLGSCLQQARLCFDRPSSVSHAQHLPASLFHMGRQRTGERPQNRSQQTTNSFQNNRNRACRASSEMAMAVSSSASLKRRQLTLRCTSQSSTSPSSACGPTESRPMLVVQWASGLTRGRRPLGRPSHIYANR